MTPSQTTMTAPDQVTVPARTAGGDKTTWIFVVALVLLFWVPDAILYMGWAKFWITLLAEVFIWGLFAVAFNLLMGYTGMISFGQPAYLGIGGDTTGLHLKKIRGVQLALRRIAAALLCTP